MPTMMGLDLHCDDSNTSNSNAPYSTCQTLHGRLNLECLLLVTPLVIKTASQGRLG